METTTEQGKNGNTKLGVQAVSEVADIAVNSNGHNEDIDNEKKTKQSRKVYIVVGEIHEFKNAREAEKYLNSVDAPSHYDVIKGNVVDRKQKISLR
jgi:hypothetical protein